MKPNRPGRILVMDDEPRADGDPSWREDLAEALQDAGFAVDTAATTHEARTRLAETFYHLLILDIRMNEGDLDQAEGLKLLAELNALELTGETRPAPNERRPHG